MIKNKSQSGNMIVVIIVILAALVALAVGGYLYYMSTQNKPSTYIPPAPKTNQQPTSPASPSASVSNQTEANVAPINSSNDLTQVTTQLDSTDLNALDSGQ